MQRRSCGDVTLLRVTTQARAFHLWGMFLPWVIQFVILLFARIRVWCNFRGTGGVLSTNSPLLILPVLPRLLKTCSDFIMNCFSTSLPVKVKHLYRIVQCWSNVETFGRHCTYVIQVFRVREPHSRWKWKFVQFFWKNVIMAFWVYVVNLWHMCLHWSASQTIDKHLTTTKKHLICSSKEFDSASIQ